MTSLTPQPSFSDFVKLARQGNLVALRLDFPSDLETPVSAFLKLAEKEPCAFLLESAEQEEKIGRYSFLGFDPEMVLFTRGGKIFQKTKGRSIPLSADGDLLGEMKKRLARYRLANPEGLPSFAGGFVGFLGYENVRFFEKISLSEKNGLDLEESAFFLVKDFLLFDHFRKTLSLVALAEVKGKSEAEFRRGYQAVVKQMEQREAALRKKLSGSQTFSPGPTRTAQSVFKSNLSQKEFEKKVEQIKSYIRAGDCVQTVFSQRFHLGKVSNDFEIYRSLRFINPSPYMFYFRYGSLRLIGSSPELLVKKIGRTAEVRPIAGTRPRGGSEKEDHRLEENLRRSTKEMAEHLMLVDLGRNDLGRVSEFKTVRVDDFARVERYSHVMHLVSDVTGHLKRGKDAFDLLRATFPAGTVTGAPKIRAMEIIDELEPNRRGPYAGCLGYFSFNQDMDMCITIRTIVVTGQQAYVQAGAGVVYDSQPRREYEETVNKAKALHQAVQGALIHGSRHR